MDDFQSLSKYHWSLRRSHSCWYAIRKETVRGCKRTVFMHRQLLNAQPADEVHHINHNTLDNRRANLRLITPHEHRQLHIEEALFRINQMKFGGTPQTQSRIV